MKHNSPQGYAIMNIINLVRQYLLGELRANSDTLRKIH